MGELSNYSAKVINKGNNIYELLSESFQGGKRLFALANVIAQNDANNEIRIKTQWKVFSSKSRNY